jgi:hypothetical protein
MPRIALQRGKTLRIVTVIVLPATAADSVTVRMGEVIRELVRAEQRSSLVAVRDTACGRFGRQ